MKNYVQTGNNLTLTAPYDVDSGDGALIGSIFGVAAGDALEDGEVDIVTVGVFDLPKTSALAIAVGDQLWWHDDTKLVNKTSASGTLIGVATYSGRLTYKSAGLPASRPLASSRLDRLPSSPP